MNKIYSISFIILFSILSCEKYGPPIKHDNPVKRETLPFENSGIKIDLITSSAPGNIRDLHFFNATKAIGVTVYGEIYFTNDGGVSWTLQYTTHIKDQPLYQILFTDSNTGYVVGGSISSDGTGIVPGGIILKTIDGGLTWTSVFVAKSSEIVSISSNSSGDLFVISNGSKGSIWRSANAGLNWTKIDSTSFSLNKIIFKDNLGFCTGMLGNIIRSNDSGKTWGLISTLDALYVTDIKFVEGSIYCMANNSTVYKSNDDGNNWTQVFHSESIFYGLNPLTKDNCLIYGAAGYTGGCFGTFYAGIGQTTNSGTNWTVLPFIEVPSILCTYFYSATDGYAIGGFNKGYLIKIHLE